MTLEKYSRQIILEDIGISGQEKISSSKVLVVGCGGIGCPLLLYLVSSGIGELTIIDHDKVSLSNIHRQILFTPDDIGKYKVDVAKEKLLNLNPDLIINTVSKPLDTGIALDCISGHDIVADGSDSFLTKYIVSDITRKYNIPFFIGAVTGLRGYIASFDYSGAVYRDIFPSPDIKAAGCSQNGVLPSVAGSIGTLLATNIIKYIISMTDTINKMISYDAKNDRYQKISFKDTGTSFYNDIPNIYFTRDVLDKHNIIDVRNKDEFDEIPPLDDSNLYPLDNLYKDLSILDNYENPLFVCRSGYRAQMIALLYTLYLSDLNKKKDIYILSGGLELFNI